MTRVADRDDSLIARCKRGVDREAFDSIVERYKDKIVNYVRRMVGDRDEADDLAQEVFVKVYVGLSTFESRSTLATWLFRIATNLCIDHRRKKARAGHALVSFETLSNSLATCDHQEHSPETSVLRSEMAEKLDQAIADLPDQLRAVMVLRDIQGVPYEDIAQIVGCPVGTVKSRLFRARSTLREQLQAYLRGDDDGLIGSRGPTA